MDIRLLCSGLCDELIPSPEASCRMCVSNCVWSTNLNIEAAKTRVGLLRHICNINWQREVKRYPLVGTEELQENTSTDRSCGSSIDTATRSQTMSLLSGFVFRGVIGFWPPVALRPENNSSSHQKEAGWAAEPVWTFWRRQEITLPGLEPRTFQPVA
jgi:hypothetical protein